MIGRSLLALAALVAGCSSPVVGGQWQTGPVAVGRAVASNVRVEFLDATNANLYADNVGATTCPERSNRSIATTWRTETNSDVNIRVFCALEVPCGSGTFNACELLERTVGGRFRLSNMNTMNSLDNPSVTLTRR